MPNLRITFEAEILVMDSEYDTDLRQAVQNEIGHTGATVTEVIDFTEEPSGD